MLANGADKQQDKQDTQATRATRATSQAMQDTQNHDNATLRDRRGAMRSQLAPSSRHFSCRIVFQRQAAASSRLQVAGWLLHPQCLDIIHRYSKKKGREMPVKEVWTGHAPLTLVGSLRGVQSAPCRSNVSLSTLKGTSQWASIDGSPMPHALYDLGRPEQTGTPPPPGSHQSDTTMTPACSAVTSGSACLVGVLVDSGAAPGEVEDRHHGLGPGDLDLRTEPARAPLDNEISEPWRPSRLARPDLCPLPPYELI
jgi:hypothetical protein